MLNSNPTQVANRPTYGALKPAGGHGRLRRQYNLPALTEYPRRPCLTAQIGSHCDFPAAVPDGKWYFLCAGYDVEHHGTPTVVRRCDDPHVRVQRRIHHNPNRAGDPPIQGVCTRPCGLRQDCGMVIPRSCVRGPVTAIAHPEPVLRSSVQPVHRVGRVCERVVINRRLQSSHLPAIHPQLARVGRRRPAQDEAGLPGRSAAGTRCRRPAAEKSWGGQDTGSHVPQRYRYAPVKELSTIISLRATYPYVLHGRCYSSPQYPEVLPRVYGAWEKRHVGGAHLLVVAAPGGRPGLGPPLHTSPHRTPRDGVARGLWTSKDQAGRTAKDDSEGGRQANSEGLYRHAGGHKASGAVCPVTRVSHYVRWYLHRL